MKKLFVVVIFLISASVVGQDYYRTVKKKNESIPMGEGVVYGALMHDGFGPWAGSAATNAEKAFDGNTSSYYNSAQGDGTWVGQDYGSDKYIYQMKIHTRPGGGGYITRLNNLNVQWSDNGSSWTTIGTLTGAVDGWNTVSFTGESHRYWRAAFANGTYGNCSEVEFYN